VPIFVPDDKVLREEAALKAPSRLGESLLYMFLGHVVCPLSSPYSWAENNTNDLILLEKIPRITLLGVSTMDGAR
jgi:hypothetical protein